MANTRNYPMHRRKPLLDFVTAANPGALKAAFDAKAATLFNDASVFSLDREETFQLADGSFVSFFYYSETYTYTPDLL